MKGRSDMPKMTPEVREAVRQRVRSVAAEIKKNAKALERWDWEDNEARCRELCAMYLEEIALTMDIEDRIAALTKEQAKLRRALAAKRLTKGR